MFTAYSSDLFLTQEREKPLKGLSLSLYFYSL
jgi:hypothetical protein